MKSPSVNFVLFCLSKANKIKNVFKIIFTWALFHVLMLNSVGVSGQTTAEDADHDVIFKELIIGVPNISEKSVATLSEAIMSIYGLSIVTYIEQDKLFLLEYDTRVFPEKEDAAEAIETNELIKTPVFIKGGTIEETKRQYRVDVNTGTNVN